MNKKLFTFALFIALAAIFAVLGPRVTSAGQAPAGTQPFDPAHMLPYLTAAAGTGATINYTAGTVTPGGDPVAVSAGTVVGATGTTGATGCVGPAFSGCNIVYATAAGVVGVTGATASTGAFCSGCTVLGYAHINTAGTVTSVSQASQSTAYNWPH